jgi:hypothetical protein
MTHRSILSIALLVGAFVIAASFGFGAPPTAPVTTRDRVEKQQVFTAAADVASTNVIAEESAVANYATRRTDSVARVDLGYGPTALPEAPSFKIAHVPRV